MRCLPLRLLCVRNQLLGECYFRAQVCPTVLLLNHVPYPLIVHLGYGMKQDSETDTENLSCSWEDFHLKKCPEVLAAACISVCRDSVRHYLFPLSLSVWLKIQFRRLNVVISTSCWIKSLKSRVQKFFMPFPLGFSWCLLMLFCICILVVIYTRFIIAQMKGKQPCCWYKEMFWAQKK